MFNQNYVRSKMAEMGYYSVASAAEFMGLTRGILGRKLKSGNFTFSEFEDLVEKFNLDPKLLSTKGAK